MELLVENTNVKKIRNSSIELLRLLLMLLIVFHHGFVHGLGLEVLAGGNLTKSVLTEESFLHYGILNSLIVFPVNAFVLISGVYSIKLSAGKITRLILSVLFFHLIFTTLFTIIKGASLKAIIISLCFFSCTPYWFIFFYLYLCLFAPLLNRFFDESNKQKQIVFLVSLFIGSCYFGYIWGNKINVDGYNLFQFFLMYGLGRYISLQKLKLSRSKSVLFYCFFCVINILLYTVFYHLGLYKTAWKIFYYNNPFVILSSICVVFFVLQCNFYSKPVNSLAKSALAIYLFQNSSWCSEIYYDCIRKIYTSNSESFTTLCNALFSVLICIIAIILDVFQKKCNYKVCMLIKKYK